MNEIRRWIALCEAALQEAIIPPDLLAPRYFHGTKKQYIRSVLAHGIYPPDFVAFGTRNTAMRPIIGRIYMTANARQAAMYGRYLLVINRESLLSDLLPDEDEVGEIFHWIMQKDFTDLDRTREIHKIHPDFIARMELLNHPAQQENVLRFKNFMRRTLSPKMQQKILGGEYAWWAKGGKAALKKMPEPIIRWLISLGVHVSHAGRILPDEAWLLEKSGVLPDGSNLAEVASRLDYDKATVTEMPPKGPPQKFRATFRWISNYPVFGGHYGPKPDKLPIPKYKTREMMFTAPSEEEARAEAELHIERTVPSAEYKIISFERVG